jgi:hypothetical protein
MQEQKHRRSQFSLFALLAGVTAAGVITYLAIRMPWLIAFAQIAIILAVTSLPVVFVLLSKDEGKRLMGLLLIGSGALLAVHLIATASCVQMLTRVPFLLDLHPFDNLIEITLNWTIPAGLFAIPLGLVLRKGAGSGVSFAIGAILLCGVAAGFIWYGNYFFSGLMGESLSEYVWWF